jgi:hypothetical protein
MRMLLCPTIITISMLTGYSDNAKRMASHLEDKEDLAAQSDIPAWNDGLLESPAHASIQTPSPVSSNSSTSPAERFLCHHPFCGNVSFRRESDRTRHARKHDSHRRFTCPEPRCQKSFYRNDKLQTHLRQKHSTRPLW